MIDGKRVVAWTPYGRERTVSLLGRYLAREHERGIVDEWWLCLNTDPDQASDLRYAINPKTGLASRHDWIKAVYRPKGPDGQMLPRRTPKQRNTGYFYQYMTDPDTVYIRLDDDMVYLHPDALSRLARHAIESDGSTLCSFALIWNNAIISYLEQQAGIIPRDFGDGVPRIINRFCMDPVAWADGDFAVKIHGILLDLLESPDGDKAAEKVYLYQDIPLAPREQFSVSAFASLGKRYAELERPGVLVPDEEESWHTIHHPPRAGFANMIVGNALVSHYTFGYQQREVFASDVLDRYRALAAKNGGDL